MVLACVVLGCTSKSGRDKVRFFCIPAVNTRNKSLQELSTRRRQLWLARIDRSDLNENNANKNTRICSRHFVSGRPSHLYEEGNIDWAPTIGVLNCKAEDTTDFEESEDWPSLNSYTSSPNNWNNSSPSPDVHQDDFPTLGISCQTDLLSSDIVEKDYHDKIVSDNLALRDEVAKLKGRICMFSEEQLALDDTKVEFYTGLPNFSVLKSVFDFVSVKIDSSPCSSLSKFQEFMVVMMRLRLNLPEQDLAYRFNMCQATVSIIIERWLRAMSISLGKIAWPERESAVKTMPQCFRAAFGNNVAVIIECYEAFTDRPSSLLQKTESCSQYQHHNSVKFVIGIFPQGTVSFISKAYVSWVSDMYIIESCGILDKLLPGDVVLADKGISFSESVGMYQTNLNIPAFIKGRTQHPSEEVQATQEIENLQIHVERVIGLVRQKYQIMQGSLPVKYLTPHSGDTESPLDQIVQVCCLLTNLCSSVTPLEAAAIVCKIEIEN